MSRRLTVECEKGHREEIIIGAHEPIKRCPECKRQREIVWDQPGSQGAPGFRVKGLTKKF